MQKDFRANALGFASFSRPSECVHDISWAVTMRRDHPLYACTGVPPQIHPEVLTVFPHSASGKSGMGVTLPLVNGTSFTDTSLPSGRAAVPRLLPIRAITAPALNQGS